MRVLGRADGYMRSELWCESPQSAQYRIKDFWNGHRDFEAFRARFRAEFDEFEQWLRSEKLVVKEEFLGAYYEDFDSGSEDDWVLS